jgi:histidyl-tRNA synthetase
MIADLGGPQVPAIGFAAGLERLLIASELTSPSTTVDAIVAPLGDAAVAAGLVLARDLRRSGVRCEIDTRGSSLKSQLRRANTLGARIVLILGESELAENVVQVKDLEARSQERVGRDGVVAAVAARIAAPPAPSPEPA